MKHQLLLALFMLVGIGPSTANDQHAAPHFPLDLTLEETQKFLQQYKNFNLKSKGITDDQNNFSADSKEAIAAGEKLLAWQKNLNANLPPEQRIDFVAKGAQTGIPIHAPKEYGDSTIKRDLLAAKEATPAIMKDIVFGSGAITAVLPSELSVEDFILHGRKISSLYQTAVRFETMAKPSLNYFAQRRSQDVRGYYHLKDISDLDEKLQNWSSLSDDERNSLRLHLHGLCFNTVTNSSRCQSLLASAEQSNQVLRYKNMYWARAQKVWDNFFKISNPRTDIICENTGTMTSTIPFVDPKDLKITNWLVDNVEDEFKWQDWLLEVNLVDRGNASTSFLKFTAGVTPHVSGGNIIVMDANEEIESPTVQWTIRHEFGHILRLPDCYVEFYDADRELMINYQLDTTDLMCSRAGKFNQRLAEELTKHYGCR